MSGIFEGDGLVLAIDPSRCGLGYVVMKGSRFLIDYRVKAIQPKRKNADSLAKVEALMASYSPSVMVLEDYVDRSSHRRARIKRLLKQIEELAETRRVRVEKFSPAQVREAFAGKHASNKYQIAVEIAKRLPQLADRLPPPRKTWMPEYHSMSIFNAAALAFTHFHLQDQRKREVA